MKKSTIAMKVISILAAIALVITTCFIPETSWADGEETSDTESQSVNVHTETEIVFNEEGCEAYQHLNEKGYIIVHDHDTEDYILNAHGLECPINGGNVVKSVFDITDEFIAEWMLQPEDVQENETVESTISEEETGTDETSEIDLAEDDSEDETDISNVNSEENDNTEVADTENNDSDEGGESESTSEVTNDESTEAPVNVPYIVSYGDIDIAEDKVPMADEPNVGDNFEVEIISHTHEEGKCTTEKTVEYAIVQPEDVIRIEIEYLVNTSIVEMANGTYTNGLVSDYYNKLQTLDTSAIVESMKEAGEWADIESLDNYIEQIDGVISSYMAALTDDVAATDEFNNIINNLKSGVLMEDEVLNAYAKTIIADENIDTLLFKFVLLDYIDKSNTKVAVPRKAAKRAAAQTGYYLGLKGKSGDDIAKSNGGGSYSALYVMKESDYDEMVSEAYTWDKYDERKNSDAVTVAYCFNRYKDGIPGNSFNGFWNYSSTDSTSRCRYSLIEDVSGDDFARLADHELIQDNPSELREWIVSVVLNGYPTNYSGFQGSLSDSQFRYVTQYAVWYYSDGYTPENAGGNAISSLTSEERAVYDKLVTTKLPSSVTDSITTSVNVYEFVECTWPSAEYLYGNNYQNLLTVQKGAELPQEPSNDVNLTLSKTLVGGTAGSTFNFTVTAKDRYGNPITGDKSAVIYDTGTDIGAGNPTTVSFDENGKATVALRSGKSIKISGMPYGYGYTIQEEQSAKYSTEINLIKGEKPDSIDNANKTISKPFVTEDTEIEYKNTRVASDNLSLKLTKKVSGDSSADKSFHFKVTLTDKNGNPLTGSYQGVSLDANGSSEFDLKDNESVTITGLPNQFGYTIEESEYSDYITDIKVAKGEKADSVNNASRIISKSSVTDDTEIVYQNTELKNLVIKKVVSSDVTADATKDYEFKIKITKGSKPISTKLTIVDNGVSKDLELDGNGEKNITITGGKEIEIRNIPYGSSVEISELNAERFDTKITTTIGGQSTSYEKQQSITAEVTNNITVLFTNSFTTPTAVVPTGIRIEILPYMLIMIIAIGGFIGFVVRRRISKGR
jgi:TQXA domain-containing protein